MAGTQAVLNNFCTRGFGAPPRRSGVALAANLDEDLRQHICQRVELLTADAASDEQLAARRLRGGAGDPAAVFPNVRAQVRDPTHGARRCPQSTSFLLCSCFVAQGPWGMWLPPLPWPARSETDSLACHNCGRITSRPWAADPYMKETLDVLIFSKDSIVNMIKNSPFIAQQFHSFCQQVADAPVSGLAVRDLQYRKHRFNSLQKPLGRTVLFVDALLLTAEWIVVHRPGAQADSASRFLQWLDEERLIQMAMCADGADESMSLVRYCDTEKYELAELQTELAALMARLDLLVNRGRILHLQGYTTHMLKALKRARLLFNRQRQAKVLGGPGRDLVPLTERCLQRMSTWVALCGSVVLAEFPREDLMASFSVFDLSTKARQVEDGDPEHLAWRDLAFKKIAAALHVDRAALQSEFEDHAGLVSQLLRTTGGTTFEAWRAAVKRTQSRASLRRVHPATALWPVLLRLGAWNGATTSGVEQTFSVQHRAFMPCRDHMSLATELDETKLRRDSAPDDFETAQLCQEAWTPECRRWPLLCGARRDA